MAFSKMLKYRSKTEIKAIANANSHVPAIDKRRVFFCDLDGILYIQPDIQETVNDDMN